MCEVVRRRFEYRLDPSVWEDSNQLHGFGRHQRAMVALVYRIVENLVKS